MARKSTAAARAVEALDAQLAAGVAEVKARPIPPPRSWTADLPASGPIATATGEPGYVADDWEVAALAELDELDAKIHELTGARRMLRLRLGL